MTDRARPFSRPHLVLLLLLLVFIGLSSIIVVVASATDNVPSQYQASVEAAQSAIFSGFSASLDAEKAGANVSTLLADLNVAQQRLSGVRAFTTIDDNGGAESAIAESQLVAEQVAIQAQRLKVQAIASHEARFQVSVVALIVWGQDSRALTRSETAGLLPCFNLKVTHA